VPASRTPEAKEKREADLKAKLAAPKKRWKRPKVRKCRYECGVCPHCLLKAQDRVSYLRRKPKPVPQDVEQDIDRIMSDPDYFGPCPTPQSTWTAFLVYALA
jgi:hypothetical protein